MFINKPNRHPNINYSCEGYYFITIRLWNFETVFGVNNFGQILFNDYGQIAYKNWLSIPEHFSKIELDEFVIIPDHIHGILIIKKTPMDDPKLNNYKPERIQMYLSRTIQQYKSSVSREIRRTGKTDFRWQHSFYDHIIRNDLSLYRIRKYINNNPVRHYRKNSGSF